MNSHHTNEANLRASATPVPHPAGLARGLGAEILELTKPRLSFLSIITALVGYLAANPERHWPLLIALVTGTSLCAGGAAVLNQWWEREVDAHMARTRKRPLPRGVVSPGLALAIGLLFSLVGTTILWLGAHPLSAFLAAFTIASYILAYTPLKRVTIHNTLIGAVPGAIPPLIGWTAATGGLHPFGWLLFAILFIWQMPHFYAIAWIYRDDYREAGFRMLPLVDPSGSRTSAEALLYSLLLVTLTLLPVVTGAATLAYGAIAALLGFAFLVPAWWFFRRPEQRTINARRLFLASILYLPLLLAALTADLLLLA